MIDLRPVLMIAGLFLGTLGLGMLVPAVVDLVSGSQDWTTFGVSAAVTVFVGGALGLANQGQWARLTIRQTFLLTTLCWLLVAVFGALPFMFSEYHLSYTDAFFEAMSGITTTGATVLTGLNDAPPGLLLWRAMLQWLGGIGFIVMAVAVLPMLRVGGMQLFRTEGFEQSEKVLPRAAEIAFNIVGIYVGLSVAVAVALWAVGLSPLGAVGHAMTSIATGGFSTVDASVGHYDSATVDWIVNAAMVLGSLPFALYLKAVKVRDPRPLLRDSQVQAFLLILAVFIAVMTAYNMEVRGVAPGEALRYSSFNVTSILTGTGYATTDFGQWGSFALTAFLFFMFIGGCAGSTTCGIKIFRFQVLYATAKNQMKRLLQPHGVFIPYYNHQPIPQEVSAAVLGFFFLYMVCFALLTAVLGLLGLDFITAVSGAASAISNVGPGLGPVIGPGGETFAPLPDAAKWALAGGMLLGRLELFTVLVLVMPGFWRE